MNLGQKVYPLIEQLVYFAELSTAIDTVISTGQK